MRSIKSLAPVFLLLVLSGLSSFAQTGNVQGKTFSSLDGGYMVELPASAFLQSAGPVDVGKADGIVEGYFNRWTTDGAFLEASYVKFDPLTFSYIDDRIEALAHNLIDAAATGGRKLTSDGPITDAGRFGRELVFDTERGKVTYRFYAGNGTVVRLVAAPRFGSTDTAPNFLNSLRFATRDEIIAQKIKDATPAALSQARSPQWMRPDLEDIARGKIKTVAEEIENPKTDSSPGKHKKIEYFFDPQGFLTKTVSYDHTGHPNAVSAYGFIDGKRVSKGSDAQNERVFSGEMPARPGTPVKKRDPRYSTRVEEKYDAEKRLAERIFYDNAGALFLRAIYGYRENRVEIYEYTRTGKLENKISQVLDAKGNIIQKTGQSFGNSPNERRQTYKYLQFDTNGNWTKRTVSLEVKETGKPAYSVEYTDYRTIAYY